MEKKYCTSCGNELNPNAVICTGCGAPTKKLAATNGKSRLIAGLLQIFLGGFGVGRFYLGYNNIAITQLALTIGSVVVGTFLGILFPPLALLSYLGYVASLWGFIDGIIILVNKDLLDAKGNPLKDEF